jgi:hypothetical protein
MPNTYTLISSNVLSSSAASVTFSAIPSTYTDLVLKVSARSDTTQNNYFVKFNSDTSNFNTGRVLYADGTTVTSDYFSAGVSVYNFGGANPSTYTSNTFSSSEVYIPNYALASIKQISTFNTQENNATLSRISVSANLYNNAAAIISLSITVAAGNFVSGSSFYLYGISKS